MRQSTIQKRANEVVKSFPSSGHKMGDKKTLNVTMADGTIVTATHDTREYYSGRGAKYNSSIRHGNIVETMTIAELNRAYKPIAQKLRRRAEQEIAYKLYLSTCNEPANVEASARKAVALAGTNTSLDIYRGCGVYRIGWRNGNITCGLYGGYHNSCPNGVTMELWIAAVDKVMSEYADTVVKMDGSGTEFFFRSIEDADLVTNATEIYTVPSVYGGRHLNIQPAFAEVIASKQLSNG